MEPVALSWLVASATSPLVAVLALWTLYVFHTYRRRWRTVDLFLLAVATQELMTSLFIFGFAILSLINPIVEIPCGFIIWGLTATRTFQITTLTSLVVDRALTVRWPYRYRFSVRRNQIRYHIAVLAVISVFVGVAAVFARKTNPLSDPSGLSLVKVQKTENICSLHPLRWDLKFTVFFMCLHVVLLVVAISCWTDVELHRCRKKSPDELQTPDSQGTSSSPAYVTSVTEAGPSDSATGTASSTSTSSTRPLHKPGRQASRRPYGPDRTSTDFRWTAVATVSLLCYCVSHLPFVVISLLGTLLSSIWSPWFEVSIIWLRLAEGLLVPTVLYLTDLPHRTAVKKTFQRRSGGLSTFAGNEGKFRMYFDEDTIQKPGGTFGSVTPIGIITNYRRTPGKKEKKRPNAFTNKRQQPCRFMLPSIYGVDAILEKSRCSRSNHFGKENFQMEKGDLDSIMKIPSVETDLPQYSLGNWQDNESHIYATLSDNCSNFSYQSSMVDDSMLTSDNVEEIYGGSFTTIANDDFEFHDTRPCGGEVRMRSAIEDQSFCQAKEFIPTRKEYPVSPRFCSFSQQDTLSVTSESTESVKDLVIHLKDNTYDDDDDDDGENIYDNLAFNESPKKDEKEDNFSFSIYKVGAKELHKTFNIPKRTTSFSMNDLDLIEESSSENDGDEAMYFLPIKSESMMSLYKVYLEKDDTPSRSRSESNLVWESSGPSENANSNQSNNPENSELLSNKIIESLWKNGRSSIVIRRDNYLRRAKRLTRTSRYRLAHSEKKISKRSQQNAVYLNGVRRTDSDKRQWKLSVVECGGESKTVNDRNVVPFKTFLLALENSQLFQLNEEPSRTTNPQPGVRRKTLQEFL